MKSVLGNLGGWMDGKEGPSADKGICDEGRLGNEVC